MNTNLLSIIKQIVADTGETVLADTQRLKAFFSDFAKDEPKPQKYALVKSLKQHGFKARLGQGEFRNALINIQKGCSVCGITKTNKLITVFEENKPFLQQHREIYREATH